MGVRDESQIPAPSLGPNTKIVREPPEERLARHDQSDVDAMGQDKRREVVGHSYGPSLGKQASLYGLFIAVTAAVVIGFVLLANQLDKPQETVEATAPWAQEDATQRQPKRLE
jgi:hypothetical protein